MIAYKGFAPGLVCRGYQFQMGLNVTDKADCAANGFHCAENPLDCLSYYGDMDRSEYYIVDAGGDIDEDGNDTKIACTELTIIKRLTREDFFLHALAFMSDHPSREMSSHASRERAEARNGYAVVRGLDPQACGSKVGDILALAKEDTTSGMIVQLALFRVDGEKVRPGIWYDVELQERLVSVL